MKLHRSTAAGLNLFTAHGAGYVAINRERHEQNLILLPDALIPGWSAATPTTLTAADGERLRQLKASIILLGTGSRLRFPPADWLRPFAQARIGLEVMDLPAACRTYNILAAEGRSVAAALLFD
ncbi:MAG: Mth938-like domain-containing protein [Azonexus sp.]|nr:Mth938-like domain-containing protein [Azonexus sp.]